MIAVANDFLAEDRSVPVSVLCRVLGLSRSTAYYRPRVEPAIRPCDPELTALIHSIIEQFPTFGVRRVWAWLRFRLGHPVNRKTIHRIMHLQGWTIRQRRAGRRPRVEAFPSAASEPNRRWATDIAMVDCGIDGWCAFVPVVDCCTREVLGWALESTARSKTAERALEEALLSRFGWLHGARSRSLALRHDNGLVFGSRHYRALVKDYGLVQEYTAPYTPEQNGLCERFIRSFKEECAWLHRFASLAHAKTVIAAFIHHFNTLRPHQALNYKSPTEYHRNLCKKAA